jgi:hypothetical protein
MTEEARKDYLDRIKQLRRKEGAVIIGDELTKKVKSRFDQWKGMTEEARRKAEMDNKFAKEEEANAKKFAGARRIVDIKEKANIKSLKSKFHQWKDVTDDDRRKSQEAKLKALEADEPVNVETAVNPVDAPVKDTKRIRESFGAPEQPENKKVLEEVVKILRPIISNAKLSGQRKVPKAYVPYMNALYKAQEEFQKVSGKTWRTTSTLSRLDEALNNIDSILEGRLIATKEKRPVGRPPAKAAAVVPPAGGWEI